MLEAALTTILDCEDSVAAVDAEDKVLAYRNWLGLMKGTLTETFDKGGRTMTRRLEPRPHLHRAGRRRRSRCPGRSLMLVRNVGHQMNTDAVLDASGDEMPEGILDAVVTALIAMHDLKATAPLRNSRAGSVYIVKPKMHGRRRWRSPTRLFGRVEDVLGLRAQHAQDRASWTRSAAPRVNLKACIRAAKDRVVFINTGFLDRTGDEIHTSMEAGPMIRKGDMKHAPGSRPTRTGTSMSAWPAGCPAAPRSARACGPCPTGWRTCWSRRSAIPQAGANTAWVPSPTAATLHALHYHQVDVARAAGGAGEAAPRAAARRSADASRWPTGRTGRREEIQQELDNNARASSATWCAGSTRASAAPRCPTSTTSA